MPSAWPCRVHEQELKLPPVRAMAACRIRERDWCNVLTAHADEPCAYTWRLYNYVIGEHVLRPPGVWRDFVSFCEGHRGHGLESMEVSLVLCESM